SGRDRAVLLADLRLLEDRPALEALAPERPLGLEREVPGLVERLGLDVVDPGEPLGRVPLPARAHDEAEPEAARRGAPEAPRPRRGARGARARRARAPSRRGGRLPRSARGRPRSAP